MQPLQCRTSIFRCPSAHVAETNVVAPRPSGGGDQAALGCSHKQRFFPPTRVTISFHSLFFPCSTCKAAMTARGRFAGPWDALSEEAVARFENPRHAGKIDRPWAAEQHCIVVEAVAGLPSCGAAITVEGAFDAADGLRVRAARFACLGGVLAVGVCEAACALLEGVAAADVPAVATLERLAALAAVPESRLFLCGIVRDAVCRLSRQARELALGGAYAETACRRVQLGVEEVNATSKKQAAVKFVIQHGPAPPTNSIVDVSPFCTIYSLDITNTNTHI